MEGGPGDAGGQRKAAKVTQKRHLRQGEYDLGNLWPVQLEMWAASLDEDIRTIFVVAPTGEGKNLAIALCSVELAIQDYVTGLGNGQQLLGGQSVSAVDRNTRLYYQDVCKQHGVDFRAGRDGFGVPCYELDGGELARIILAGGDNSGSAARAQGMSVHHVFLDEAAKLTPEFIAMASTRRRDDRGVELPTGKLFMTMNADNPLHPLKATYLDQDPPEGACVIQTKISENPYRSQQRIQEMRREGWPAHMIARLLDNVWAPAEGSVYQVEPWMIVPPDVRYVPQGVIGMDVGMGGITTALLLVERPYGHEVAAEYYWDADQMHVKTEDGHISALLDQWTPTSFYPDPSAYSMKAAAWSRGMMAWDVDNTIDTGVFCVRAALASGKLRINRRCRRLLEAMASYVYNPKTDKPIKDGKSDHMCDTLRYAVRMLYPPNMGAIV